MNWESPVRWCLIHEVSAVEDLDHCWKSQWYKDNGELIWRRCRIVGGRLHLESVEALGALGI